MVIREDVENVIYIFVRNINIGLQQEKAFVLYSSDFRCFITPKLIIYCFKFQLSCNDS